MKIWYGYGTEHSANLVIVGRFKTVEDAKAAETLINEWTALALQNEPAATETKFGKEFLDFFAKNNFMWATHGDSHTLIYDYDLERKDDTLIVKTEETEFAAFLKVMLNKGARIETYSAHDYKDTPYGRGQ
jgi:Family of unknown function (DUF6375)